MLSLHKSKKLPFSENKPLMLQGNISIFTLCLGELPVANLGLTMKLPFLAWVPGGWLHVLEQCWRLISFTLPFCCNSSFSLHQFQFLHTAGMKQSERTLLSLIQHLVPTDNFTQLSPKSWLYPIQKPAWIFCGSSVFPLDQNRGISQYIWKRIKEKGICKMMWTFN